MSNKWVLLKFALVLALIYAAFAPLPDLYRKTSDARYSYMEKEIEIAGWYGLINDAFLSPIIATSTVVFLVLLVVSGTLDIVARSRDRLKTLLIAGLFFSASVALRMHLLLSGWAWGSDWFLHSSVVYDMMVYKDYRGFGWGWTGGDPSIPGSTYICNPPLPYLSALFLLQTFIPNMGISESTYISHINQYIIPMLWTTTAIVESLAFLAVFSIVRRVTGRLSLAILACAVCLLHPSSISRLGNGQLGQIWGQSTLAISMLFLARSGEKMDASNWVLLTLTSWVTLNTHKSVYVAFPMIVVGYLILSSITRTVNKTAILGVVTSVAAAEALAWLSFWNYGINYYTELGYIGINWAIWEGALMGALTPGGVVLAIAGVITLLLFVAKRFPERRYTALLLPWVGIPFIGTLGWVYGYSQSRLILRYFYTIGLPGVALSTIPFAKIPRKYAVPLYAVFLVYILYETSPIRFW